MRNAMWVGGGITGMGGIPMLGTGARGLTTLIKGIFRNNEQGFAYDPNDLTAEKINWRRNLTLYSEDFSKNAWGYSNATVTANSAIAPDGTMTADKLVPNTKTAAVHQIYAALVNGGAIVPVNAVKYTMSVYVKAAEYSQCFINFWQQSDKYAYFDLITGTVISTALNTTAAIVPIDDGWFRCSITSVAIANVELSIRFGAAVVGNYSFAGDGSSGLLLWGAQLNTGEIATYQPITDYNADFLKVFPLHTLYQDAAGTIPVTAAGQPVGLMLDKSKGLVLGSELFTGFVPSSNTTVSSSSPPTIITSTASSGNYGARQVNVAQANKSYLVQFDWTSSQGNGVEINLGSYYGRTVTGSAGTHRGIISTTAVGNFLLYSVSTAIGQTFTIANVSIKELAGNHAYQTVSASRPILQKTPILGNELLVNGDFSNGTTGWMGIYGGVLSTQNGNLVITSDGTSEFSSAFQQYNFVSGRRYKISFKVVDASQSEGVYGFVSANNTGSSNRVLMSSKVVSTGFFEAEFTAANDTKYITIGAGGGGLLAGGAIYFDNVSVKEITGYRTDQNYLEFDGVDDFLQTNSIDFTSTDKVSLFAGVRKLSDGVCAIAELSNNIEALGNTGAFLLAVRNTSYAYFSKGTVLQYGVAAQLTSLPAPNSSVLVAKSSISTDLTYVRANNSVSATVGVDQGTGNYGNYPLYIGRRGGASLPFNGHLYSLIGIGRLTTDSETTSLEKSIAKNTGVTL